MIFKPRLWTLRIFCHHSCLGCSSSAITSVAFLFRRQVRCETLQKHQTTWDIPWNYGGNVRECNILHCFKGGLVPRQPDTLPVIRWKKPIWQKPWSRPNFTSTPIVRNRLTWGPDKWLEKYMGFSWGNSTYYSWRKGPSLWKMLVSFVRIHFTLAHVCWLLVFFGDVLFFFRESCGPSHLTIEHGFGNLVTWTSQVNHSLFGTVVIPRHLPGLAKPAWSHRWTVALWCLERFSIRSLFGSPFWKQTSGWFVNSTRMLHGTGIFAETFGRQTWWYILVNLPYMEHMG